MESFIIINSTFDLVNNKHIVSIDKRNVTTVLYCFIDSPEEQYDDKYILARGINYTTPIEVDNDKKYYIGFLSLDADDTELGMDCIELNKIDTTSIRVEDIVPLDNHFVYFKIPTVYYGIYLQLLNKMGEVGKDLLDECKASCKGTNQQLLACWNMFNAACAEYIKNSQSSTARTLIKYVINQLHLEQEDKDYYQYSIYTGVYHPTTGDYHEFETVQVADLDINEKAICSELELAFEFNHTDDIHFIILPENVSLSKVYYKSDKIKTYLFNDEEDINDYQVREVWSDNKKYYLYWYYSPIGRIDEIIKVKCKTNNE